MNLTHGYSNVTGSVNYWDMLAVVGRNVIVVVLGIIINYINATMVHTFNKHHVCKLFPFNVLFFKIVFKRYFTLLKVRFIHFVSVLKQYSCAYMQSYWFLQMFLLSVLVVKRYLLNHVHSYMWQTNPFSPRSVESSGEDNTWLLQFFSKLCSYKCRIPSFCFNRRCFLAQLCWRNTNFVQKDCDYGRCTVYLSDSDFYSLILVYTLLEL